MLRAVGEGRLVDIATMLTKHCDAEVDERDELGRTVLADAACHGSDSVAVKISLKYLSSANKLNGRSGT
eukprot:SAG11_NODE_1005_length_6207_cov_6.145499_2_plen_69_part_00